MGSAVKVTTTFRFQKSLLDSIRAKAKAANRSLNNYVECVLIREVEENPNNDTRIAMYEAENNIDLTEVKKANDLLKLLE